MRKDSITPDTVIQQHPDVVAAEMDDSVVLLSMQNSAYVDLKETGGHIWRLIDEPKSVSAVCDGLMDIFDIKRAQCEASTIKYVEGMIAKNLIEIVAAEADGNA